MLEVEPLLEPVAPAPNAEDALADVHTARTVVGDRARSLLSACSQQGLLAGSWVSENTRPSVRAALFEAGMRVFILDRIYDPTVRGAASTTG